MVSAGGTQICVHRNVSRYVYHVVLNPMAGRPGLPGIALEAQQ